jgi:hypothetical protein
VLEKPLWGAPERCAISSMRNDSPSPRALSSASAVNAFKAYFIFCVIMRQTRANAGTIQ